MSIATTTTTSPLTLNPPTLSSIPSPPPPNLLLPSSNPSPATMSQPVLSALPPSPPSPAAFSSHSSIDILNGKRIEENGFIYVSVKGDPGSRGYAQGFLLADRIIQFIRTYAFFVWSEYGRDITFFTRMMKDLYGPIVLEQYNEYYLEMKGIANGVADKISKLSTKQDKDKYFTEGAIEGNKIVLPADSHLDYSNLVYNNASEEEKQKYTPSGKILIDPNFDIIFLLNCIVSVEYVYGKLADIFNNNKSLKSSSVYKEYFRSLHPTTTSSGTGKSSGKLFSFFNGGEKSQSQSGGSSDRCSALWL